MMARKGGGGPVRTGIFGGSFNPVHLGHVGLARRIVERGLVDEVWLMVSPRNPLKASCGLAPEADRLQMARLAVAGVPGVEVSDFEFDLPRPSYTAATMRALVRAYPGRTFSLIVGADNWEIFSLWREYEYLLGHYPVIVYPRRGRSVPPDVGAMAGTAGVTCIAAPEFPYSSTRVREALRGSEGAVSGMLSPEVLAYIKAHKLYSDTPSTHE